MPNGDNIYLEREPLGGYLTFSAGLHVVLFGSVAVYSLIVGMNHGANWGNTEIGESMRATLVSRAPVPLPQTEQTENIVANESKGLTESQPQAIEKQPDALPIPDRDTKKKPDQHTNPDKTHTPP